MLLESAGLLGGAVRGRPRRCPDVWPALETAPRGERDERHPIHGGPRSPGDRQALEDVTTAFERQLGRFDPDVYKALAASGDAEGARARIEAMAGPSGFMLFASH